MSINKLIADTNIDLDIVDLSEDECKEQTEVKPKEGTVVISSEQNNTNEQIEINIQNDYQTGINWDLLGMETDHEEVKSQNESQSSDNSLLLLEAGSGSLLLSSREKGLDKNETECLGSDIGGNGDNHQSIFVSSSESKIGSGNLDLGLNVNKKPDLPLGVDENGAITDAEDKEISEKKVEFILVGADYNEMGKEAMQVLDKNGDLNVDKNQGLGLNLLSDKVSEIDNMGGLNENSASDACADNSTRFGSGEADDNCVLKKGVNSNVLIEDVEMGYAENKDKGEEVDCGKLNLEGIIANRSGVRGDLEMNVLESGLEIIVQGTTVGANTALGTNRDQAEYMQPSVDNTNTDSSLNSGPSNDTNQVKSSNESETVTLGSLPGSKSPKKRGRPRKSPGNMNVVVHDNEESPGSREQRKRDKSWIRKGPYVMYGVSNQIWPEREEITKEEAKEVSKRESKKVKKTADGSDAVFEGNAGKTKFSEEVVQDLLSAAQGLLNPEYSILRKPARGFLTSFRNFICINEVAIAPPPVLLDARDKMEDMIMSLQGSGLEDKESLIRDARGLLKKVNLMLAKSSNGGTVF